MPRLALTDKFLAGVKPAATQVDYFDAKCPGLAFRLSGRTKTWCLFYTSPKDGKRARATLGHYPQTTLAAARTLALEAKAHLDQGVDPRDVACGLMTVGQLADSYLSKHVRQNLRSANAVERRLKKNVLPVIGGIALPQLHRRDVNRVIDALTGRGCRAEAARVFGDMRTMFRWGMKRGDLDTDPTIGLSKPAEPSPRERVLSDDEIAKLWSGLEAALPHLQLVQSIIRLCLLTGQRVGEVCGIQARELDRQQRQWTIPAARSKNKHSHVVPLTELGFSLAEQIAAGETMSGQVIATIIGHAQERFEIEHWTAHDLRRTVVTQMARLGVAPIVLGHVINHRSVTKAGVTLSVYAHYDYAKEKRQALELWAAHLDAIVKGGAKVLPLRGAR